MISSKLSRRPRQVFSLVSCGPAHPPHNRSFSTPADLFLMETLSLFLHSYFQSFICQIVFGHIIDRNMIVLLTMLSLETQVHDMLI